MKFPTVSTPTYEVKLLSKKEPVKFRPFLVKEQKLMLLAVESNDMEETIELLKTIATNCVLDSNFDVEELPLADLEMLFLHLRARSMGEKMPIYYKCKNLVPLEDGTGNAECGMVINLEVNLLEVPFVNAGLDPKIQISNDIGMQLKYPSFKFIKEFLSTDIIEDPNFERDGEFIGAAMSIDFVYDKDNVYYAKDASLDEMLEFIYNLPQEKYNQIGEFLKNSPTVRSELPTKCPKCGYDHNFVLEGLSDFFT